MKYLIPAISTAATVTIFLLFMPAAPTWFYWLNLTWAALLALLSSLYLTGTLTKRSGLSTPIVISLGFYISFFVLLNIVLLTGHFALVEPSVLWVITDFPSPYARLIARLAPLFLEHPELGRGIYLVILIIGSAIFAITVRLLIHFDHENTAREMQIETEVKRERQFAQEMRQVASAYKLTCNKAGVSYREMPLGQTPLDRLARAFDALTPNAVRNASARSALSEIIEEAQVLTTRPQSEETMQEIRLWTDCALERTKEIKMQQRL